MVLAPPGLRKVAMFTKLCRPAAPPCEGARTLLIVVSALLLLLAACNGSTTIPEETAVLIGAPLTEHPHIVLRDGSGNQIMEGSAEPYSPRETCGACHDYHTISTGYHFQQGRTDEFGAVDTKDDYFNDGRDFLKSSGMYGKW